MTIYQCKMHLGEGEKRGWFFVVVFAFFDVITIRTLLVQQSETKKVIQYNIKTLVEHFFRLFKNS